MMGSRFEPADGGWEERVRASFDRQGAMRLVGASIAELGPGICAITLPFRPELSQQHGYFHAGISSAVADSAGGYAALTLFPAAAEVLTVEFKINLLAPALGEALVAEAAVVRSGRTLTVCSVDVLVERGGSRFPCALMQQTLMRIDVAEESGKRALL
jgi:uncharacterized protein (TIGR00369 family)